MYPVLPFGPFTVPTAPVVILIAVTIGLEIAGRFGRRFGLPIDDVWNTGLIAILAGLIVARLWNVIQFWPVYLAEPWLIISMRPSGFILLPGIVAAIVVGYSYLLYRALDPLPIITALFAGGITAWALIQAGGLLTGEPLGTPSTVPWAISYYGELRHPVALYYGVSFSFLVVLLWFATLTMSPSAILLLLFIGVGVSYLVIGAFEYDTILLNHLRMKQLMGLLLSLIAMTMMSRRSAKKSLSAKDSANISDK